MAIKRDVLNALMAERGWLSIDEMLDAIEERDGFDQTSERELVRRARKTELRRVVERETGQDGFPAYGNVEEETPDGETRLVYKLETLFDIDDYRAVVGSHFKRAQSHYDKGLAYQRRCEARYGIQLPLLIEMRDLAPV